ncbi:hypothetical protein [Paenarthrobacter sp. PH39-S1]|uniref:hypothetical protein n=1 Tax=Paenarthrobacter sp. PH39-S1 TaxID=3046204 RepID=UPI0024B95031|nr:hypothetical protein [Paenarthrobacter sp. PH39-S1]MDJ0358125.1 hypothetical protein [Paenarthrobacter sp. PH39-S1]
MTWEKITVAEEQVTIDLAGFSNHLEAPLDKPVRALAVAPLHTQTAAHPNSPWVFRGMKPGQHVDPAHLRQRLKPVFSTLAARMGTLHELTRIAPAAIIALRRIQLHTCKSFFLSETGGINVDAARRSEGSFA